MKLLFIIFSITLLDPIQDLKKTEITENVTMYLPADFRPMTDDEIVSKYFTTKKPMALFTDPSATVDLGVNQSVTTWDEKDIEIMVSFQKSNIFSLYDKITILNEGTQEIGGRKHAFLEFVSEVKPEENSFRQSPAIKKYSYMQYVIVKQKALVFNFSCPVNTQNKWQPVAQKVMSDITIKGKIK